jgi:tetratricopeptide (TPR) repeat protein
MSVKIISVRSAICFFALTMLLAGCTPAGPRALLKGKKYLDRGDYAAAVAQFKTATTLLATNAAAWNYYAVALQRAGQPNDAVNAYRRALELDRDLFEARLNLGTLFLEQSQPDSAKTEFTACTLRRPNDATGWLKLGGAQLRLGEIVSAERSFSAVLTLKTNEAEAYNGLGLARIQRNRPQEAAQFFTAAVQARPDFAPAILNLATVSQQHLRDPKTALENFQKYLALTPRPANWEEVNAIVAALEQSQKKPAETPAPVVAAPAPAAKPAPSNTVAAPAPAPTEAKPQAKVVATVPVRTGLPPRAPTTTKTLAPEPAPATPVQAVQVAPAPKIVSRPEEAPPTASKSPVVETGQPKPGLWGTVFGSTKPETSASKPVATGVTPLPSDAPATATIAKPAPPKFTPPAAVHFPRYQYLSPRPPAAGNRPAANGAFTQARAAEQNQKWTAALEAYRQAAAFDPSWFEAQYNTAVLAQRLRSYSTACSSYETALAIKPDSTDARYNFALTLKAAGYVPDAAAELKKILAASPGDVRAHLALANLCAQSLHDPVQARQHYQKVLELDPANARANDIRYWLAANPG